MAFIPDSMQLFRIAKKRYADDLSGEGARLYGGRWNRKGTPALYTSESVSLAAMEVLVNLPAADLPDDLRLLTLHLPEDASMDEIKADELTEEWTRYPPPVSLAEIGNRWFQSCESLLLRVPSAVIPWEQNVLINPRHEMMKSVNIQSIDPFGFDERLGVRNTE